MYTIVLAAVLTTGNTVPDWGCRGGCHGCWGCRGGCHGCWGGCYGCWGCYGCYGCYGCWGGCYGCWGCYGCGGGCYGCGGGVVVVPTAGGTSAVAPAAGSAAASSARTLQDLKKSIEELKKEQSQIRKALEELKRSRETAASPTQTRSELPTPQRGKLLLDVPEDALVVINDKRINAGPVYLTPPLEPGKEQILNVEAAAVRDGKSINRFKRVTLHGGEVVRLAFKDMEPADGSGSKSGEKLSAPAHITVRLPADARLTVNGVACPLTSDTRTFDTPVLAPGQKYYYLLRAEVVRDGQAIAQTRRVDFRAGERVSVSFADLGANLVTTR